MPSSPEYPAEPPPLDTHPFPDAAYQPYSTFPELMHVSILVLKVQFEGLH